MKNLFTKDIEGNVYVQNDDGLVKRLSTLNQNDRVSFVTAICRDSTKAKALHDYCFKGTVHKMEHDEFNKLSPGKIKAIAKAIVEDYFPLATVK